MDLDTLRTRISLIVQDSSFGEADLTSRINQAVSDIAAGLPIPGCFGQLPPLPDLYSTAEITLLDTSRSGDMPADYQRGLFNVTDSTTDSGVTLLASFQRFMKRHPILETGSSVDECVAYGSRLYVHPAINGGVNVSYYATPATLVNDTDEPDCIPAHLQEGLIVNLVCRDIFSLLEDGMEMNKINTAYHQQRLDVALHALHAHIGIDGTVEELPDEDDYIE